MTRTKIPIWLDCDPGQDDTVAILLALFHPSFELVGISTTYGNASVGNTTNNALSVLTTLKCTNVPVYIGAATPLEKRPLYAPDIHGKSGLDGTTLLLKPSITTNNVTGDIDSMNAALWKAIETYGSDLSIVAIGPLTNMAVFFTKYPQAKSIIYRLSIMGGGFYGVTNVGSSEFNIYGDPKAANVIFKDDYLASKTVLIPLNVTHTVLCTKKIQKAILNGSTGGVRKLIFDLMTFFASSYAMREKFKDGPPVHDPIAIYALLDEYGVEDIGSTYQKLRLSCVEHGEDEGKLESEDCENGVKVIFQVDTTRFWNSILDTLTLADEYVGEI